jgi:hypothetical protein
MFMHIVNEKRRQFRLLTTIASMSLALTLQTVQAAITTIGPLPYLSATDSPFLSDASLMTVLEDFEDGALNVPGIVNDELPDYNIPPIGVDGRGVVMAPGPETDSIDGDDGSINGLGIAGNSFRSTYYNDTVLDDNISTALRFHFEPSVTGQYPTAFGFVWTDGEINSRVEAGIRDLNGDTHLVFYPQHSLGDAFASGGTAEDRFFGIVSSVGIVEVSFGTLYPEEGLDRRRTFELDHLQFAYPVPEPSAFVLLSFIAWTRMRPCRRSR